VSAVSYDEGLADRIRELLAAEAGVTEQAMFGGLSFLVGGHMAVAASGQGGLLVRVDPADAERLLAAATASPMEMGGRPMRGWLRVDATSVRTKRQLTTWVARGVTFARTLPPKAPRTRKRTAG
jgi:TfoX/Sxy family transcriptional regulator of competence genes